FISRARSGNEPGRPLLGLVQLLNGKGLEEGFEKGRIIRIFIGDVNFFTSYPCDLLGIVSF
ncbi:MAG TPA: hypothetical protein VGJ94_09315, partial [Syntrophorhabdaceae bacterium]